MNVIIFKNRCIKPDVSPPPCLTDQGVWFTRSTEDDIVSQQGFFFYSPERSRSEILISTVVNQTSIRCTSCVRKKTHRSRKTGSLGIRFTHQLSLTRYFWNIGSISVFSRLYLHKYIKSFFLNSISDIMLFKILTLTSNSSKQPLWVTTDSFGQYTDIIITYICSFILAVNKCFIKHFQH